MHAAPTTARKARQERPCMPACIRKNELLSLTGMATPASASGFQRQVTFRIGPEDALLLEAAARANGGIQAGIIAALRAYAAARLQADARERQAAGEEQSPAAPEDEPPRRASAPRRPPRPRPQTAREELVELNVGEAASVLGVPASSLRERIKRGAHPGRVTETGFYLAHIPPDKLRKSGVELSPRGAAEVLGLRPATIKKRCKAGRYPSARDDGLGWKVPASDLL